MPKCKAIVETSHVNANGDCFSEYALEQMVNQAKGLPVTLNFEHGLALGKIERATLTDKGVEMVTSIIDGITLNGNVYLAPGGTVTTHQENGIQIIDTIHMKELSLTFNHADAHATPIQEVKEEECA